MPSSSLSLHHTPPPPTPHLPPHHPANPRHRLKSTMTKWTAVDWRRGTEESQVPEHGLIPRLPHHCSDKPREQRTDTGSREDENINASFICALQPASTAVWKHNCNENPIDWRRFLLDKLQRFPGFQLAERGKPERQRWKPQRQHRQCSITRGRCSINFSCKNSIQ